MKRLIAVLVLAVVAGTAHAQRAASYANGRGIVSLGPDRGWKPVEVRP